MYKFSLYSAYGDRKVIINEENDTSAMFYRKLLAIFSEVDNVNKKIIFTCLHKMDNDIRNNISGLVSEYDKVNVQVRRIGKWFSDIKDGEYFCVFPETEFTVNEILFIFGYIELLNKGVAFDDLENEMQKQLVNQNIYFSDLLGKYSINVFSPRKKHIYGNKEKASRVCKYCGKDKSSGAAFHDEAHAIPESLGNKTIISADECDTCNAYFSKTIDIDIFEYFKLFRVLYGRKGKEGVPTLKFKNKTEITHDGNKAVIKQYVSESENSFSENNFKISLELIQKVNLMNIYRSLVKYVIAVIPNEEIKYLTNTIKWIMDIKNNGELLDLPPIAIKIDDLNYNDQPTLVVYKRKDDDTTLPYMYAELRITNFICVYILPFANKDIENFGEDEKYKYFWNLNKHYSHFNDWVFNKFNLDLAKETILNMQMKKHNVEKK